MPRIRRRPYPTQESLTRLRPGAAYGVRGTKQKADKDKKEK